MSEDEYRKLVRDVNMLHEDGTIPDEKPMIDTANLEDGFYWVRCGDEWEPAEMQDGKFWLIGIPIDYDPRRFDEIDPRTIKREDVK